MPADIGEQFVQGCAMTPVEPTELVTDVGELKECRRMFRRWGI